MTKSLAKVMNILHFFLCLSLGFISACDDSNDQVEMLAMNMSGEDCAAPSGECFRPDWEVNGNFVTVKLVESEPMEPIKGSNRWIVTVSDLMGTLQQGCTLHLAPFMPDHMHGSNEVDATEIEPGRYELKGFELTMPGYWELVTEVNCPMLETDQVTFPLWLES